MSNVQAQYGFQHIGYLPGYAPDMAPTRRMIQSTYATAIYYGDPVFKNPTSPYIEAIPANNAGTSGSAVAGIFQGCYYTPTGQAFPSFAQWYPGVAGARDATALIIDSPGAMFRVAALLTAVPASSIGNNVGWSTGAGGTTLGAGYSTFTVDQATITTSTIGSFTIIDMWSNRVGTTGNGVDNANPYNWVVVTFNNSWLRAPQTGVA